MDRADLLGAGLSWLTVTAWRKAIDQLRRDRLVAVDADVLDQVAAGTAEEDPEMEAGRLVDDRLGLVSPGRSSGWGRPAPCR